MKKRSSRNKFSLIPLYIGVVGHRDIRDEDRETLKQMIKDFIEKKQKQCPNTPVVILTPLAEGADRIAAEAAIDCKIDFIAVLPMPVEEYKKDFVNVESAGEFETLLAKASFMIELPLQEGITIEQVNNDIEKRNEQYYQNGLFIARQCHTLVAFWDGTDNGKRGGTADVVKLKKSGIPPKFENTSKRLHYPQTGLIYHIVTPRKSNPVPKNPLTKKIIPPSYYNSDIEKAEENDTETLKRINSFNKDITKHGSALKGKIKRSTNKLCTNHPDLENNPILHIIAEKHGTAGELASFYQNKRFFAVKVLLALVVLAFILLHINTEFLHQPLIFLLFPIIMGIGAIWYLIAKWAKYEYKHEDYRALSEAYRVQFFLRACGNQDNVSDHYLKKHRGQLEWILYTLSTSQITDWEHINTSLYFEMNNKMIVFVFLKASWVDNQITYFKKNAKNHYLSSKKWEFRANSFFIFAIVSSFLLFLVSFNPEIFPEKWKSYDVIFHSVLSCFTSVFLVLAAALHGYSDKMIFAEQAKNYQQMAQLFELASDTLTHAIETNDEIDANNIIMELAKDALLENGDWLLLHRSRPLEIPKG